MARTNSKTVSVLGTGVQGRTQLRAVCAVRPIERVLVFDMRESAATSFRDEMGSVVDAGIEVAGTAAAAVRQNDIVCTATTSKTPVFDHRDIRPGAHVNAIGSYTPQMQELPTDTVSNALLVVDSREAVWAESGDLIIPRDEGRITEQNVHAELGDIVNGTKSGRENDEQITLFKSVGNAVQDVSVGARVLAKAEEKGLGTVVEM